jgi:hypothetical protein
MPRKNLFRDRADFKINVAVFRADLEGDHLGIEPVPC